jgi:hypothetical protein
MKTALTKKQFFKLYITTTDVRTVYQVVPMPLPLQKYAVTMFVLLTLMMAWVALNRIRRIQCWCPVSVVISI